MTAHHDEGHERPLTDEERARLYLEQVKQMHILDLVRAMLVDLVTLGYQKLGLTAETSELRDLDDARVAIETVRRLVEVLESEGARDEARTYRATLAAMQLQFATVAGAEAGPTDEGPAEAGESQSEVESEPTVAEAAEPKAKPKPKPEPKPKPNAKPSPRPAAKKIAKKPVPRKKKGPAS
jgi:hypothetical protein